jgi:hypothetical protein
MASSSVSTSTPTLPRPTKSVWKDVERRKLSEKYHSQPPVVNGHLTDDAQDGESISSKDKDSISSKHEGSVSSKDIHHSAETESQGHLTPASSWADDVPNTSSSPTVSKSVPTPVIRPAPIPTVNPWLARQREQERKKQEESVQTTAVVIPPEPAKPVQPVKALPKANGVVGMYFLLQT